MLIAGPHIIKAGMAPKSALTCAIEAPTRNAAMQARERITVIDNQLRDLKAKRAKRAA